MSAEVEQISIGLHRGITEEVYAKWPAVRSTALKHALSDSMLHAEAALSGRMQLDSDAADFGSAYHAMVFEPERFVAEFIIADKFERKGKAAQEKWADLVQQAGGCADRVVWTEDRDDMLAMAGVLSKHKAARRIIAAAGETEIGVVWIDPETGLRCKARLDKFAAGVIAVDLKTTVSAHPAIFGAKAAKLWYHVSAAYHHDGFKSVTGVDSPFSFIAQEKTYPFAVAVYEVGPEVMSQGRLVYREGLRRIAECVRLNEWPGYGQDEPMQLRLPSWAFGMSDQRGGGNAPEMDNPFD